RDRSRDLPRSRSRGMAGKGTGLVLARRDRARVVGRPVSARAAHRRALDHGRRARLLRHRAQLRGHRPLPDPRRARELRNRLSGDPRDPVQAVRLGYDGLRGGEGDQRRADVARGRPRLLPRTARAAPRHGAGGGRARGRTAAAGLRGNADDGERVLSALPLLRARTRLDARAADREKAAARARALRHPVPDPRAGGRARHRRADRAARARLDRARPARPAGGVRAAVRSHARRRARRDPLRGRPGTFADRRARQLQRHRQRRLPGVAVLPLAALPRRGARSRAVGAPVRRADRRRRDGATHGQEAPDLRRCGGDRVFLARPRGGRVRVALLGARRGAEPLLPDAVVRDRAARVDRTRSAPAAALNRGRWDRGRSPAGCAPVLDAARRRELGVGHSRPASLVVRARHAGRRRDGAADRGAHLSDALGAPLPGADAMPETKVAIDRETGVLRTTGGATIDARYVLIDNSTQLLGTPVARDVERGMVLYRVTPPARTATRLVGLWPNDTWSKADVEWFRANCRGGRLVVHVHSDPTLFPRGQQIVAVAGGAPMIFTLRPHQFRTLVVPIQGRCDIRFTVTPTKVPGNGDNRELGAHFDRIEYRPSRGER